MKLTRTSDGVYEGTIAGVAVRVTRGTIGTNAYGERSKTPEWRVRAGGRLVADGHQTMSGAIAAAELILS